MAEEQTEEWISVEDEHRLPKDLEMVAITDGKNRWAGYYLLGIWHAVEPSYKKGAVTRMVEVTHWRSLPKPQFDKD